MVSLIVMALHPIAFSFVVFVGSRRPSKADRGGADLPHSGVAAQPQVGAFNSVETVV
jgi:hypothetical protein